MLLSVLIISVLVTVSTSEIFDAHAENDWLAWKDSFSKSYSTQEEETVRKDIWKLNAKTVANHNMNFKLGKTSFSLSLNALADLNDEERKGRFLRNTNTMAEEDRPRLVLEADVESVTAIKPSVDWRDTDRVTSVKTQVTLKG
eukprot:gi/632989325/ref/XP_007883589.1/ PREDICTED: cathepsin L1-like [Callorhinchus milii]